MSTVVAAFLTSTVLMASPATVEPAPPKPTLKLHPIEKKIIDRTNAERARYGLHPLRIDHSLVRSARSHCGWMTNRRSLTHTRQPVGENIAMGQRSSVEVVRDWMSSPGHRANILNGGYTRIGAACYRSPDGTMYWCQQFLR